MIADSARGRLLTVAQTALSLLRNYSPDESAARASGSIDLLHKFDKQSGGQLGGRLGARDDGNRKNDEWLLMFVAGMWFQDLWTYDFRRTEMCIIPYATQMGEISFCAYNTGVGWRQIVENMYQNAKVADWYKEHGKHPVYANPTKACRCPRTRARLRCTCRRTVGWCSGRRSRRARRARRRRFTERRAPLCSGRDRLRPPASARHPILRPSVGVGARSPHRDATLLHRRLT